MHFIALTFYYHCSASFIIFTVKFIFYILIAQSTIQQIFSKIDIIDIVGSYVKLKKRGTNYLGLCPFHNEKSPSFTVSPAKEIYKCFGCGKSGNGIGFIMELEKFSYVEALRYLAKKYNVEIEETETTPEQKLQQQSADSLYIINQFAQQYFSNALFNTEEGQDVGLSYLKQRGFREDTIKKFQIGYNPAAKNSFATTAVQAQYNIDLLQKSGLVVVRDEMPMDNYRGRIIFPIHNQSGKVLGFGARILKTNDKAPKYINTPENDIYVKSKILYGSYFARQAIDKADECLLVEGYTDVVALHQAGVENVVASGGTSLTIDQLRLVKKYTNNLTIIYDGDGAGVKAALRGMDMALEEGLHVKLVLIPDNEDPDSYVNKVGATAFIDFIAANKKDFILFQLSTSLKDAANDTVKKSQLVNQIAETIAKINRAEDFSKQQDYIKQSAALLKIEEEGLHSLVNKFIRDKINKEENKFDKKNAAQLIDENGLAINNNQTTETDVAIALITRDELQEKAMVRSLIEFGCMPWHESNTVAQYIFNEIDANELEQLFDNNDVLTLLHIYKNMYQQGLQPNQKSFLYHDDLVIAKLVMDIMDFRYEISPNWKEFYEGKIETREELYKEEVYSTLNYLKLRKIKRLMMENQSDLEKSTTTEEQLILLQTHQYLKKSEIELTQKIGTVIFK